jgi:hypothetical protein
MQQGSCQSARAARYSPVATSRVSQGAQPTTTAAAPLAAHAFTAPVPAPVRQQSTAEWCMTIRKAVPHPQGTGLGGVFPPIHAHGPVQTPGLGAHAKTAAPHSVQTQRGRLQHSSRPLHSHAASVGRPPYARLTRAAQTPTGGSAPPRRRPLARRKRRHAAAPELSSAQQPATALAARPRTPDAASQPPPQQPASARQVQPALASRCRLALHAACSLCDPQHTTDTATNDKHTADTATSTAVSAHTADPGCRRPRPGRAAAPPCDPSAAASAAPAARGWARAARRAAARSPLDAGAPCRAR